MKILTSLDDAFYRSNITFTSIPDIIKFSEPLAIIGITYFTFDRTYNDGSHIRLTNSGSWIENYYRQELYKVAIFERPPEIFSNGYVLWDWLNREPIYSAAALHNIDHGLTIIESHQKYSDFFHFGTACNKAISPENLISRIDYLKRFILCFKQKMKSIIDTSDKHRIKLPSLNQNVVQEECLNPNLNSLDLSSFINKTEFTRLYLDNGENSIYLTHREIEVLLALKAGERSIQAAKDLAISERTLESHINNIKEKFECKTMFELGYRLGSLSMKNFYPFKIKHKEF